MKTFSGALVIVFMLFFNEIEAAGNVRKIKTKDKATASELDDQARNDDHHDTPSRQRKPSRPRYPFPKIIPQIDKTGENAYDMFVEHYRGRSLPNTPETTLKLYEERHADGSYYLPPEDGNVVTHKGITHRIDKARERYRQPLVNPHTAQQYQDSSGMESKGLDALHRYKTQREGEHQAGSSGSGSGNNYPHATLQNSLADEGCDVYKQFDIPSPPRLDFDEPASQYNVSASLAIDYSYLSRQHRNHS